MDIDESDNSNTTSRKRYFFIPDGQNYSRSELIRHFEKLRAQNRNNKYDPVSSPAGVKVYISNNINEYVEKNTFENNSVKYNDLICPITLEKPNDPVILNLNGRIYSKVALLTALQTTVCQNRSLRFQELEITQRNYDNIKIYHVGQPNQGSIEISPVEKYPTPDRTLAELNEKFELSSFVYDTLAVSTPWDSDKFAAKMSNKFLSEDVKTRFIKKDDRYQAENFVIKNKTFANAHPKISLDLRNVHFINCQFSRDCYCQLRLISCTFERCQFIGNHIFERGYVLGCDFRKCVFVKYANNSESNLTTRDLTNMDINDNGHRFHNTSIGCVSIDGLAPNVY